MKTKADRYGRNRILRRFYGSNIDLEFMSEEEKDHLYLKNT